MKVAMGFLGCLCVWGFLSPAAASSASSIFSAAPSGAARPGPVMILSPAITELVRGDACARATHDRLVKEGKKLRAEMIVVESLHALESGKSYEVKLEGRSPFVARTKISGRACAVAQFPSPRSLF